MLAKIKVKNYKVFEGEVVLDLTDTKGYSWNEDQIVDGVIKNSMIYGKTGSGKTTIAEVIQNYQRSQDLTFRDNNYIGNFNNMNSNVKESEVELTFKYIDGKDVMYKYVIDKDARFLDETLYFGEKVIVKLDRKDNAYISEQDFGSLKIDFLDSEISILQYLARYSDVSESHPVKFVNNFLKNSRVFHVGDRKDVMLKARRLENNMVDKIVSDINDKFTELGYSQLIKYDKNVENFAIEFENGSIPFYTAASTGQIVLFNYLFELSYSNYTQLDNDDKKVIIDGTEYPVNIKFNKIFILDEYSANYDFDLAEKLLRTFHRIDTHQTLITTHNTNLLTNRLSRPDCIFIVKPNLIANLSNLTEKEIRKGHNLERMFIGGEFTFIDE